MPMSRGGEKWSDSWYMLKVELTGCAEGLGCGKERKRGFRDDIRTFEDEEDERRKAEGGAVFRGESRVLLCTR